MNINKKMWLVFFLSFKASFAGISFSGNDGVLVLENTNSSLLLGENITDFDGTLRLSAVGVDKVKSVSDQTIRFNNGKLQTQNHLIRLPAGTYTPNIDGDSGSDAIILGDGDVLDASGSAQITQSVRVGNGSTASIIGTPNFSLPITLHADGTSVLQLGIQNKLNQNIAFSEFGENAGTVVLKDNLSLMDNKEFVGNGTIDLAFHTLTFGFSSEPFNTGHLYFEHAMDIQLNGPKMLREVWFFNASPGDTVSVINGHGNVLKIAGGGISVGVGHTLYVTDVHIKNLRNAEGYNFTVAEGGTIVLSNVTLEFMSDYTSSSGLIRIAGGNVRLIVGKPEGGAPCKIILYNQNNADLKTLFEVDGQALIYDTLGGDNANPFYMDDGQGNLTQINLTDLCSNGGVIRSATEVSLPGTTDTIIDAVVSDGNTVTLTQNYDLYTNSIAPGTSPTNRIVVTNGSGQAKTVTIDGSGYTWKFPDGNRQVLVITANTTVILQNVMLENFAWDSISFEDYTAVLRFADFATVSLRKMTNLGGANRQLVFSGYNTSLLCNGNVVSIDGQSSLQVIQGGMVSIVDGVLQTHNELPLQIDPSGAILFQNCKLLVDQLGLSFNSGTVVFIDMDNRIDACATNIAAGEVNVAWKSSGAMLIFFNSCLAIGPRVIFSYEPDINADDSTTRRNHFELMSPSSRLFLDGCTISTVNVPLTLSQGHVVVNNKVQLNADHIQGEGFETEIASGVIFEILGASVFSVDGNLKYIA